MKIDSDGIIQVETREAAWMKKNGEPVGFTLLAYDATVRAAQAQERIATALESMLYLMEACANHAGVERRT